MNIFIDTEDMEERYGEELYKEYLEQENKELHNKTDKAIEYIEDRMIVEQSFCLDMKQCYELTEILKDSDVDE